MSSALVADDSDRPKRHRALWATKEAKSGYTLSMPKAILLGVLIEASLIYGVMSVDFDAITKQKAEKIMKVEMAKAPEPKQVEEEKPPEPEPKPEPKPEVRKEVPKKPQQEAAPIAMDAPGPGPGTGVSIPTKVGPTAPPVAAPVRTPPPQPAVRRGAVPLFKVTPDYPRLAKRDGIEGHVVAHLTIEPDGRVSKVVIVKADPEGMFDKAVREALMEWKFAKGDVQFVAEMPITFKLE